MEVVQQINPSLQDEHVIAIDPPLKPDQPGVWRRRINAFPGRSLTEKALTAEQEMRAGLQRLQGLSMTSGVVDGLTVIPETDAIGSLPDKAMLQLFAGLGLARSGEDVSVGTTRQFSIGSLPLILPVSMADRLTTTHRGLESDEVASGAVAAVSPNIRMLRPLLASAMPVGRSSPGIRPLRLPVVREGLPMSERLLPASPRRIFGSLNLAIDAATTQSLPRVAILVAQPIDATILGRQTGDCPPDPREDPYSDLQRIDGSRLLLFMWPEEMAARSSGPDYSIPPHGHARRNQLAYRVFDMERTFQGDEMHPWEEWGVPLALIGFTPDWRLDFVDRSAVVRKGGTPKPRSTLVPLSGEAGLWQARIDQMIEHLGSLSDLSANVLRANFERVPPSCVLPANCFNPVDKKQVFFPSGFGSNAIPIPKSSLEAAVKEASGLLPYNLSVAERVELLIPVPDHLYEPGLLTEENIDDRFSRKIEEFKTDRDRWITVREQVRRRYDRLMESASGVAMAWPQSSTPDAELCPPGSLLAPLSATRTRRYAAGTSVRAHSVETSATLQVNSGDVIWFWVRVHSATNLSGISLRMAGTANNGMLNYTHGVYFGAADGLEISAITSTGLAARNAGNLPQTTGWLKIEVPADRAWNPAGNGLSGLAIAAVEFAQKGGDIEFGPFGKTDAAGMSIVWIGDDVRGKAIFRTSANNTTAIPSDWAWTEIAERQNEPIPEFGTQLESNARSVAALEAFKVEWTQDFLDVDIARLDEGGLDAYLTDVEARLKATNDAIDLGFVRARSDIYRVRQFMLGADSASRLVTSPALADLAKRDEGARVTSVGISDFIKKSMEQKTDPFVFTTTPGKIAQAEPTSGRGGFNAASAEINVISEMRVTETRVAAPMMLFTQPQPAPMIMTAFPMMTMMATAPAPQPAAVAVTAPAPAIARSFDRASAVSASVTADLAAGGLNISQPVMPIATMNLVRDIGFPKSIGIKRPGIADLDYTPRDVRAQRPAPGLVERTLSVAERLTPPPAVQALEYAVASKAAVIQTLRGLMQNDNGRPNGIALNGIYVPGYAQKKGGAGADKNDVDPSKPPPTIEELVADLTKGTNIYVDIDDVREKLKSQSVRHESDYFTAAVQTIDNAIALMRLVEDRVTLFERLADRLREVRSSIFQSIAEAAAQLRLIDTEIDEARHDIATATALLDEETARLNALKERRRTILRDHVTMIAYRRVRESNHRSFAPVLELGSALSETAMAECRREHPDTPSEIAEFTSLFRDSPVKWFPRVAAEVARIDRAEAATRALEKARQQAMLEQARQAAELHLHTQRLQTIALLPLFQQSARKLHSGQKQLLVERRLRTASLDIAILPRLSLVQAQQEFGEHATLGDAADGSHDTPVLTKLANGVIQDFASVAACLHAEFAETPATIRLSWAESLSQYDSQVDLQSLASLPEWGKIERDLRRNLQSLVDHLFARIDRDNPKAVALVSNLVRISMLLVAHAPVRRLIPAKIVREQPARIGTRLMIEVDTKTIRKEMTAIIRDRQDRIVSRAVIEDMIDGRASARIINLAPQITTILPDMRVELSMQTMRTVR